MLLDIILIICGLLAAVIGYKVGFLRYILHLASLFTGLIISLVLTKPTTLLINKTPLNPMAYDFFYEKLHNSDIFIALGDNATIIELLKALGFSEFFATFLEPIIINMGFENENLLHSISLNMTSLFITLVTFLILWLGSALIIWVFKMFAELLRKIRLIKFIDGIFGIALSFTIMVLACYVVVASSFYLRNINSINEKIGPFVDEQYESSLGLYKYFEYQNIVIEFVELIFSSNEEN